MIWGSNNCFALRKHVWGVIIYPASGIESKVITVLKFSGIPSKGITFRKFREGEIYSLSPTPPPPRTDRFLEKTVTLMCYGSVSSLSNLHVGSSRLEYKINYTVELRLFELEHPLATTSTEFVFVYPWNVLKDRIDDIMMLILHLEDIASSVCSYWSRNQQILWVELNSCTILLIKLARKGGFDLWSLQAIECQRTLFLHGSVADPGGCHWHTHPPKGPDSFVLT